MIRMVLSVSLRQSPTRPRDSRRPSQLSNPQKRSKYLDNKYWQPYRNNDKLAQRIYRLTHPDYLLQAERELS